MSIIYTAQDFMVRGWEVFPLPPVSKFPPPKGVTGADGSPMDEVDVFELLDKDQNLGIRLPPTVIGLDWDEYKDTGSLSLRDELIKKYGELPPTYTIRAKGRTEFYSIPKDTFLRTGYRNLDIIQRAHRYAIAPGSTHPTGIKYTDSWDGLAITGPPAPEDLPALPTSWLKWLKDSRRINRPIKQGGEVADNMITDLSVPIVGERGMCPVVRKCLRIGLTKIRSAEGSRHDAFLAASWAMVGVGKAHSGARQGLQKLLQAFMATVGDATRYAEGERMIIGAIEKNGGITQSRCSCGSRLRGRSPRVSPWLKAKGRKG